ncbi:MAG: hypothetical protein N3E51_01085 [Candidatus Micrarchaeota archaeon]|nr:hypothetical protein [Candidatus Micrarchaeota archaeon]
MLERASESMRASLPIFCLLFFAWGASAVQMISPLSSEISNGALFAVGNVGPGQTFAVVVNPKVEAGGRWGLGGAYDQLYAASLPSGWSSTPSKLYANPLQADITVPKDAPDGQYEVELVLHDESGAAGLGDDVRFRLGVIVSRDVMDMRAEPPSITTGASQPARYSITVLNKGIANDVFSISSKGVSNWEFSRSIYIPSGTSRTLTYEVVGDEEEDYKVELLARSSSSEKISAKQEVSLRVKTDLLSDLRATNRGVLLLPLPEAPAYFAAGLLSNLFK